jgi:hypothetical protein
MEPGNDKALPKYDAGLSVQDTALRRGYAGLVI